ncbi:cell division inhibitor SepF [Microbacteriaceae bacterium MWH-Ta3]|nr:cell division inhibitor SepF [Microbacteriaceae bacterium MWH-Ta3]
MKKALVYFGLAAPEAEGQPSAARNLAPVESRAAAPVRQPARAAQPAAPSNGFISSMRAPSRGGYSEPAFATIHQVRPTRYAEAEGIALTFREGSPMVIDLGTLQDHEVRRMIDFLSGLVKGLDGDINRVSGKVYMLTPAGMDLVQDAHTEEGFTGTDSSLLD